MSDITKTLQPCPFCGGQASHNTIRTSCADTIRLNGQDTFYGINCIQCGANNRGLLGHKSPEQAAERWNARPIPAPVSVPEEWRIALGACAAALSECTPCMEPECKAIQEDSRDTALAAATKLLAANKENSNV